MIQKLGELAHAFPFYFGVNFYLQDTFSIIFLAAPSFQLEIVLGKCLGNLNVLVTYLYIN